MKKLCYIAGKITGLEKEEVTRNFDEAKKEVAELGYLPTSPTDLPLDGLPWNECMSQGIAMMLRCKAVYALRNHDDSRGAKIELKLAAELGMEIIWQK